MNPPYQRRGRLWSDTDKAYLIDSIINGFDVPKLYMADFTWGDSPLNAMRLPYAIIDGKQRLEAVFDFFDGNISLNDDFVYLADTSLKLGGLGYKDLQQNYSEIAEIFDNYNLSIMSVVSNDEKLINDLFVRLNRSKPLTGAEIRNAMAGPAPEVIRQIAKHDFFLNNVNFTVRRGDDLNAAAKILMFEFDKRVGETKKRHLDEFVKSSGKQELQLELAGRKVIDNLDNLATIFLPKDKLLTSSGMLPVYYWLIRDLKEDHYPKIREFLIRFEEERKENRTLLSSDPESAFADQEIVEFDKYNRSTNDAKSHEERYKILKRRFNKWLKQAPV